MTSDYIARNRSEWNDDAARYQARHAAQLDASPTAWGMWSVPEDVVRAIPDVWDRDILELGCGAAAWSVALASRGARVTGLDLSDGQLGFARSKVRDAGAYVRLVQADAEHIPLRDASYDVVFCDHGALSWADPQRVLPEVARVLRPGGRLAFCTMTPWAELCWAETTDLVGRELLRPYFDLGRMDHDDDAGTHFTHAYGTMLRAFASAGFEVEDLVELRPGDGSTSTYFEANRDWARRWPAEHVWKARRRREPALRLGAGLAVRPCRHDDLDALARAFGPRWTHERRIAEQDAGTSTYLVAFWDLRPAGHLNLRWTPGPREFGDAARGPEVNALGAWPRDRGIGTALLGVAETLVAQRGFDRIGLGVEVENTGARRLYERNGYVDWGRGAVEGSWAEPDGTVHVGATTYMSKRLR